MYSFLVRIKPRSYNSWGESSRAKKADYKLQLETAFVASCAEHTPMTNDLYGLVYHFYKKSLGFDADNISKPVWDCLRGVLFDDDKRVKMRIAGSFDIAADYFATFDSSAVSGELMAQILVALETADHVLYVECGTFSADMIRLNLGQNAN